MNKSELLKLLPKFREKFFYTADKSKTPFALQRRPVGGDNTQVGYDWQKQGNISDQMLLTHFSQKINPSRYYDYASLAIEWQEKPTVKWICLDFDHDWQIALREKFLACLSSYGIECLWEVSRGDRSHNWFMLDNVPLDLTEKFMLQVMTELELVKKHWEVYPLFQRRKAVLRIPGGYHFKAGKANGVIVDGQILEDPCEIIQAFLDLPTYSADFIQSKLKAPASGQLETRKDKRKYTRFVYLPRNMTAPMEGLPKVAQIITGECQAYRKLIVDAVNNELIDKAGINHHNSGLVLAKFMRYADFIATSYPGLVNEEPGKGAECWETLVTEYRTRGYDDHQWDARPKENPQSNVWKCETMDTYFGLCDGCPFKKRNGFETPKQLFFGQRIEKVKIGEVNRL